MKEAPRWVIPLEEGTLAVGGPRIEVSITAELEVELSDCGPTPMRRLPSLVALHLGTAIQSAAIWCGQERARREARRKP